MKRVIFTTYDDINRSEHNDEIIEDQYVMQSDYVRKSDSAKQQLVDEYMDRIVQNKKDYADKIGVDFIFYKNTMEDFDIDVGLEFTKVNIYKHHLMRELANKYDEILYVDMDVIFNTDLNVFEEHNLNNGIHVRDVDCDIDSKNKEELLLAEIGLRSPTLKYHITKDLLDGADNHVINTGIILAKSEHIIQLDYIQRIKDVIPLIEKIKTNLNDDTILFTFLYYPNNESIFSYILEKFNVPYVLLEPEWHQLYGDKPSIGCEGHMIHFINKQFARFFNDKTQCIFSLHIDIPEEKLDNPKSYGDNDENKSSIAKRQLNKYRSDLLDNHRDYANAIGAEYKHFGRDAQYEEFYARFPDLSEYDVINLYKIWLLDKISKEYDLVAYADFDCFFNNYANVFQHVPCDYALCVYFDTADDLRINKRPGYFEKYKKDFRNPEAKYWNAHALLTEADHDGAANNYAYNTGVIITSKRCMEQLDFFGDIDEILATMKDLKEDEFGMYPDQIRASFGYDNETIFSYKVSMTGVNIYRLSQWWHHRHYYDNKESFDLNDNKFLSAKTKLKAEMKQNNTVITHFISKNFGLVFNK